MASSGHEMSDLPPTTGKELCMDRSGMLDALLRETRVFRPRPDRIIEANLSPADHEAARQRAEADPEGFWDEAASELYWFQRWYAVHGAGEGPDRTWFPGGRTNIAANALDRHLSGANRHKLAVVWEGERGERRRLTYLELDREVRALAAGLRGLGVAMGDRVALYLPALPETAVAVLACAVIGAACCPIFSGFSAKALRARIEDSGARVVITADGAIQNGKEVPLKPVLDEALAGGSGLAVEAVVVVRRTGADVDMAEARDIHYDTLLSHESGDTPTESLEAEHPLAILYGADAAGRPRGLVHVHGGLMVGLWRTMNWVLDVKPSDLIWCTADPAWITGLNYGILGPLLAGATTLLCEGNPLGAGNDRLPRLMDRHGVSVLYTTPTTVRMLRRFGGKPPKRPPGLLRLLATVGEPMDPETWVWLHDAFGRAACPVLDSWWQTETGAIMLSPLPISPLKPGSVGKPLPGVAAEVVDAKGAPAPVGKGGYLVLKHPLPSMARTIHGDPEGFRKTYWDKIPGVFFTGDLARRDADGFFWIQGRADDVLHFAGHRVGNAELEGALASHRAVSEAAVIAVPDPITGSSAKAFIVPVEDWMDRWDSEEDLIHDIKRHLARELGPFAAIRSFSVRESLPKTDAGKISRQTLRREELEATPRPFST